MRSITTLDLQYAHRFYGFKGEAQYLHGHTGVLTIEVEDSVNEGVNMVFPCNEIQKTAWEVLKNFDHALVLREDDPLLPAVLAVYEKQGIRNGAPTNTMKGPAFETSLCKAYPECRLVVTKETMTIEGMAKIINGIEIEESDFDTTSDFEYDIPWIGTVDVRDISLGVLAIVLGFLDGINPCAMWVLLFLITLVLGSKSKKRIWAIGGVFLLTSGVFYFLMMTAWIETVQLLVNYVVFQYIVGALALVAGGFNLYSFIKAQIKKEDGCKAW